MYFCTLLCFVFASIANGGCQNLESCAHNETCQELPFLNCTSCQYCCWDGLSCWQWANPLPNTDCKGPNAEFCSNHKLPYELNSSELLVKPNRHGQYKIDIPIPLVCKFPYYRVGGGHLVCGKPSEYSIFPETEHCKCGKWSSLPNCTHGCLNLDSLSNIRTIKYTSLPIRPGLYELKTIATVTCLTGFYSETATATCVQNGTWNPKISCEVGCLPVILRDNLVVNYIKDTTINGLYVAGTNAIFNCVDGYYMSTLTKSAKTKCIGGQWWGITPTCTKGCPTITDYSVTLKYSNGLHVNDVYSKHTKLRYDCKKGFSANTSIGEQVCKEEGNWDPHVTVTDERCFANTMCKTDQQSFRICQTFGNRSCTVFDDEYYDTCRDCCYIERQTTDIMCLSNGCFCNTNMKERKIGGSCNFNLKSISDTANHFLPSVLTAIEDSINYLIDQIIGKLIKGFGSDNLSIQQLIKNSPITQLASEYFLVMSEESGYDVDISSNFYSSVNHYCIISRRGKSGYIFTVDASTESKSGKKRDLTQLVLNNVETEKGRLMDLQNLTYQIIGNHIPMWKINRKTAADDILRKIVSHKKLCKQSSAFMVVVADQGRFLYLFDDEFVKRLQGGLLAEFSRDTIRVVILEIPNVETKLKCKY